jgi:hypothetical protein
LWTGFGDKEVDGDVAAHDLAIGQERKQGNRNTEFDQLEVAGYWPEPSKTRNVYQVTSDDAGDNHTHDCHQQEPADNRQAGRRP